MYLIVIQVKVKAKEKKTPKTNFVVRWFNRVRSIFKSKEPYTLYYKRGPNFKMNLSTFRKRSSSISDKS